MHRMRAYDDQYEDLVFPTDCVPVFSPHGMGGSELPPHLPIYRRYAKKLRAARGWR